MRKKISLSFNAVLSVLSCAHFCLAAAEASDAPCRGRDKADVENKLLYFQDRVRSVQDTGPAFEITFKRHAEIYFFPKKDQKEIDIAPTLSEAVKSKACVKITAALERQEILAIENNN